MGNEKAQYVADLVAGARPNFIKVAPVERAMRASAVLEPRIIHTGQHYDPGMNGVFFEELGIPAPYRHLGVGSGSHGRQTARILEAYERQLVEDPPDLVVIFGDVNSTLACALASVKLGIPLVHVEAGLRSFDRSMPEEINRLLVDAISALLLLTEESGVDNLLREGIARDRVVLTGNVMIDSLVGMLDTNGPSTAGRLGLHRGDYGLVTMHRPSNVDEAEILKKLLLLFRELAGELPMVFPVHPRTRAAAERFGLDELLENAGGFHCLPPVSYAENLALMRHARVVLTDSGGMQEETSFLRVPCITLRENTERPVTIERGTSRLVGNDPLRIRTAFGKAISGQWPSGGDIPLWDGRASMRVVQAIESWATLKL